jgi:hypothetical protein
VVPLANAFRPDFARQLSLLTSFVRGLTIPVVVVGVGAQTDIGLRHDDLAEVDSAARDFVAAVLERSASIGVRGVFTADYLRRLGFPADAIEVIGCPSVFANGPDFRLSPTGGRSLSDDSRIALNVTPGVPGLPELVDALVDRYPGLVWIGQDGKDLRLTLWGEERRDGHDPRLPVHTGHRLFQEGRARFPLDMRTWVDCLSAFDFVVGTRFHGNVAGTLADTPAVLLAHDSRTWELAGYLGLPHLRMDALDGTPTAAELFAAYQPDEFNRVYPERFGAFTAFLERNGLSHVHTPGNENPVFAREVAEADLPPMVEPLTAAASGPVLERLRWLNDGQRLDLATRAAAYRAPYPQPRPRDGLSAQRDRQRDLVARVGELEKKLGKARKRNDRLRENLRKQERRLRSQAERLQRQSARLTRLETRLDERFGSRLARKFRRG